MPYNFESQKQEWTFVPDDSHYLSTKDFCKLSPEEIHRKMRRMSAIRYSLSGYRNFKNKWRSCLGLDSTEGKVVLDFGCGLGMESLQFAPKNQVYLADITENNLKAAELVLEAYKYKVKGSYLVTDKYPFWDSKENIDVFYCNGVLHHIPYSREILKRAVEVLNPDGEIRLMLYSDEMWKHCNTSLPSVQADVQYEPDFIKFVRFGDKVGQYADWYNAEKILYRFGDFLKLVSFEYITDKNNYLVAILKKR